MRKVTSFGLAVVLAAMGHFVKNLRAQETPGRAEVRGITGKATSIAPDGKVTVVKARTILVPGTTIKTGPKSAVDLFLGKSAGVLRLAENSTLTLKQFKLMDAGGATVVEIQLDLDQGTLLGRGATCPPPVRALTSNSQPALPRSTVAPGASALWATSFSMKAPSTTSMCPPPAILFLTP